jgi:hypothetical protein
MKIALITATGDRELPLALCRSFVNRSTVQPDQWVVVDDGKNSIAHVLGDQPVTYVRRRACAGEPRHTLPLNLIAAAQHVDPSIDWVVFWEDDDWYAPTYLEHVRDVAFSRPGVQIIGQSDARYYRVKSREYQHMGNITHASLCATAIHRSLLPLMVRMCEQCIDPFVDIHLWRRAPANASFLSSHPLVVGVKELPGRKGLTYGWRGGDDFVKDADGEVLRSWVGANDAAVYAQLLKEVVP